MSLLSTPRALVLASLLILSAPATARADFFVVPFTGIKFGGSTSIVDLELAAGSRKLVLGGAAMRLDDRLIGYEVEFGTMTGYFENGELGLIKSGSFVLDLMGSAVIALPPQFTGGGLRPYVVVGGGLIHAEAQDFFEIFQVRRTVPAFNLGIGATGLFTNNVGVRFDARHLRSVSKDASSGLVGRRIAYTRFTIGLLLRL